MKRFLFSLAVFFSALLFMLSPAGTTKVKAADNLLGTVNVTDINNDDIIWPGTTIINNTQKAFRFSVKLSSSSSSVLSDSTTTATPYFFILDYYNYCRQQRPIDRFPYYIPNCNAFQIKYININGQNGRIEISILGVHCDYTWSPATPEATTTSTSSGTLCSHDYQWETEIEPTDNEDGEEQLKCTKCGNIIQRQSLSAFPTYIESCMKKISDAKDGDTVTITSHKWNSYPKSFFEAIAAKNITVTIEFPDELHHMYTYTVTSEQAKSIADDYTGPETMKVLGATELVK